MKMDLKLVGGLTLEEALQMAYSDDLDVANIYIEPPETHELTDEDSGEEDNGGMIDNLPASQLRSPAELQVRTSTEEAEFSMEKIDATKVNWEKEGDLEENVRTFPASNYDRFSSYTPFELFQNFFDENLINLLVLESQRYAHFKNIPDPQITHNEMMSFLIILIVSGYNELPGKKYYWDMEPDMKNVCISDIMRRDRFLTIFRFLHCADNSNLDKKDKMSKLRPVIENLKKKFLDCFIPESELNYDESMIKYFGKHSCKQFIRGKPIRFGYKVWCINTKSGYLVNFNIYQGSDPASNETYQKLFGKAAAPLVSMLDDFPAHKKSLRYTFFFDNLFTGFTLLKYLKERGYDASGTIRENRIPKNCPLQTKKQMLKMPRGEYDSALDRENGIIVVRWADNNVVTVASTNQGTLPLSNVKRFSQKEKRNIQVS